MRQKIHKKAGSITARGIDCCGYLNINPELVQYENAIMASGRFYVYFVHPEQGSCTFIIEKDENKKWVSKSHPPFVNKKFIGRIGERIENEVISL